MSETQIHADRRISCRGVPSQVDQVGPLEAAKGPAPRLR
jgi:hypothetical protein